MALKYVYSGAAGAATGADWANAYTTLAAALTAMAAGDTAYVAHDHAETQASAMTMTPPGTAAASCYVVCVNRSGSVPPVSADLRTTATVTTTGANAMTIATPVGGGSNYFYGIAFNCGTGATNAALTVLANNTGYLKFINCALKKLGTTGVTAAIILGSTTAGAGKTIELVNTPVTLGATTDRVVVRFAALIWWSGTALDGTGAIPTTLIGDSNSAAGEVRLESLDLSNVSGIIIGAINTTMKTVVKRCKLHASATFQAPLAVTQEIHVVRCDSGATNYRHEKYQYMGTQTVETTIVRTGGASDGATPIAWKIITTANSKWAFPFTAMPITFWNETIGSAITVGLEGIWGGGAVPNNDDIWMDVDYPSDASSPLGSVSLGSKGDVLATGSALAAGSGTWGGSTTKFKLSATFTPQQKGPITLYVKAAAASSTFYIDPKPTVAVALGKSFALAPGVYVNEGSSGGPQVIGG